MTLPATTTPVIIIGAGAAGLITAARLRQRGVPALILEAAEQPGATWAALYDSLHLHTIAGGANVGAAAPNAAPAPVAVEVG